MNEYDYLAKASRKLNDEKYHEVIKLCDKALKINEELSNAYDIRGNANYYLKNFPEAFDDFSQAIKRMPDNPEYYYDRSCANKELKNYEDAIVDITKAIELKPNCSLYYYDKARTEYYMGRFHEAISDITKGIELKPTERKYLYRGLCHEALEEYDLAFADYDSAIEIYPESFDGYCCKACLKRKLGNYKSAILDLKKAEKINPDNEDDYEEKIPKIMKIFLGKQTQ